jgi:hypothetical protein
MTLRDLLGLRPKADTVAALRASLTETETALAAVRSAAAGLEAERGAMLLDASPAEAEEHERKLMAARAEAERLAAIAAALPARIATAEARERAAELDRIAERAEAEAAEAAALVPQIVRALETAAELVERHDALALKVQAANRELRAEGRDKVALPLLRVWPHDPTGERPLTLGKGLSLPGPRGPRATLAEWRADLARAEAPPIG